MPNVFNTYILYYKYFLFSQANRTPKMETRTTIFFSLSFLSCWIAVSIIAATTAAYNVRENLTRTVSEIIFCL